MASRCGQCGQDITSARLPANRARRVTATGLTLARPVALSICMGHRVDHCRGSEDQDVVLTWRDLHAVGVTDPEPALGHLGHPLSVALDRVLMVDDVALDPQVRA